MFHCQHSLIISDQIPDILRCSVCASAVIKCFPLILKMSWPLKRLVWSKWTLRLEIFLLVTVFKLTFFLNIFWRKRQPVDGNLRLALPYASALYEDGSLNQLSHSALFPKIYAQWHSSVQVDLTNSSQFFSGWAVPAAVSQRAFQKISQSLAAFGHTRRER